MNRYLCIHGHFYQPPRENPWLEVIERQDSAEPFHDWNERITTECYAPNAHARILDDEAFITGIVSNYDHISFNFGPTLLSWMEHARPRVYEAIINADKRTIDRFGGHGSAIAQVYNHMILPLANTRDRNTQVRWGLRDFERRFGRKSEGMWLPETAVDVPTLEVLAEHEVRYTILAPRQAARMRWLDSNEWFDVRGGRIDPRRPYLVRLPSGRSISVFFYDGPISQGVAFERLLANGERFASRLLGGFEERDVPQLVNIATDGETYGHHHRHGEMALAYALQHIEAEGHAKLTNYGQYLELFPPEAEVEIAENTSWSCIHGIDRWRADCGCGNGHADWNQEWRAPLREALDWLRDELSEIFERRGSALMRDPWAARDEYIDIVLDRSEANVDGFMERHGADNADALRVLEMQRHGMLMFTSCGWFFEEISRIEGVQILSYAARAIQIAEDIGGVDLEPEFLLMIAKAKSNNPDEGDGRKIFLSTVRPARVDLRKLVAHHVVDSMFQERPRHSKVYAFTVEELDRIDRASGIARLALGRARVVSSVTRTEATLSFGILHLGDHNLSGGVRGFRGDAAFREMMQDVTGALHGGDLPAVLRLLDKHFPEPTYSLRTLFREEQRQVLDQILASALGEAEIQSRQLYDRHSALINYAAGLDYPLPKPLRSALDLVVNAELRDAIGRDRLDFDRIRELVRDAQRFRVELDRGAVGFVLEDRLARLARQWAAEPTEIELVERLCSKVELARTLGLDLDLWVVTNIFFERAVADLRDERSQRWKSAFGALAAALRVRLG